MKDELINLIQPNCLLPFQSMALWLDNVVLVSDPTGAVRQQIKTGLRSNGSLTQASWELLINNVVLEENPPINNMVALQWVQAQGYPNCTQLKIFIDSFAIGTQDYFKVLLPAIYASELNIKTSWVIDHDEYKADKHIYHVTGGGKSWLIRSFFMHLYVSNWNEIKDAKPQLVLERYTPKRKNGLQYKPRKAGYKRDRRLVELGGDVFDGWSGQNVNITQTNLYRPNFIPLTGKSQKIDIYAENYIRSQLGNKSFKFISGNTDKTNRLSEYVYNIKVPMRARLCIKCNGKEIFSPPLIYFSIFAKVNNNAPNEPTVDVQFSF